MLIRKLSPTLRLGELRRILTDRGKMKMTDEEVGEDKKGKQGHWTKKQRQRQYQRQQRRQRQNQGQNQRQQPSW